MGINLGNVEKRIENIGDTTGGPQMVTRARISLGNIDKANKAIEKKTGWTVDLTEGLVEGGLEIDASGSMGNEYRSGNVQSSAERVTAFYAVVDANGQFPVGFFHDDALDPVELNLGNYRGWVNNNVPRRLGMTNLFDAIYRGAEMAAEALGRPEIMELVRHSKSGYNHDRVSWALPYTELRPVAAPKIFHFTVIGDGAPTVGPGKQHIRELITRMSFCGIFIKFIFVGRDRDGERFLDELDDMKQRKHPADPNRKDVDDPTGRHELRLIDNVDKVKFSRGLGSVTDEEFAAAMSQELDTYVPSAVLRGVLTPA
jgi:hypothetical protein